MEQRHFQLLMRWICVLPVVGLSFVASISLALFFTPFIFEKLFSFGIVVPHEDGVHFELVWDGPLAAIFFVLSGALVAPKYQWQIALALFGLGAFLTPMFVSSFDFSLYGMSPDNIRLDAVAVHWTYICTYTAGALAVACVFLVTRWVPGSPLDYLVRKLTWERRK